MKQGRGESAGGPRGAILPKQLRAVLLISLRRAAIVGICTDRTLGEPSSLSREGNLKVILFLYLSAGLDYLSGPSKLPEL